MSRSVVALLALTVTTIGITLARAEIPGCVVPGAGNGVASAGNPRAFRSTDNQALDAMVARLIAELSAWYEVRPDYLFIEDLDEKGGPAPNAFAAPPWHWRGPSRDGGVLIGLNILRETIGPLEAFGITPLDQPAENRATLRLRAVLAHEFGHVVQFKARNVHYGPFLELEADRLAGWHIGRFCDASKIEYKPEALSLRGDTGFMDRRHHGTRLERELLFTSGSIDRSPHIHAAYRSTLDYLLPRMADVEFLRRAFPETTAHLPATGRMVLGRDCSVDQFGIYSKGLQGDWTVDWQYIDGLQQAADKRLLDGPSTPGESAEVRAWRVDGAHLRLERVMNSTRTAERPCGASAG